MTKLRFGRDPDVLRNVGRARLECAQDSHQHWNGALQKEGDVIAGRYTVLCEQCGETVCLTIELLVRDRVIKMMRGNGVRVGRGLRLEGVMDAGVGHAAGRAFSKALKEKLVGWR